MGPRGDSAEIPDEDWDRLQEMIDRFETAWDRGEKPRIGDYLPDDEPHREALLLELVHAELEFRLKAGDSARVEDYLRRYPSLERRRQAVIGLIRTEWLFRRRREPHLNQERFRERFPDYWGELDSGEPDAWPLPATPLGARRPAAFVDLPLPRRLGKYELRRRLGVGSFGVVYLATDTVLGREVAVKVALPEAVAALSDIKAFLREARNSIDLRHPNIVAIHDAGPIDDCLCIIRVYIEGMTLAERIREAPFSVEESAALITLVAEALDHAHRKGIYHRDLKPSNILLDVEGRPHVADFGLAKRQSGDSSIAPGGNIVSIVGTPAYMSPEQARGDGDLVDGRSDVYSVGVVLYELLTGTVPFRGRGRMLLTQIEEAQPIPPRSLNDEIPPDLEAICLKALAKEPFDRYQRASEMAEDLRTFLAGRSISPTSISTVKVRSRTRARSLMVARIVALIVLVAIPTALWIQAEGRRSRDIDGFERSYRTLLDLARPDMGPDLEGAKRPKPLVRRVWELERQKSLIQRIWDQARDLAPTLDGDPALLEVAADAQLRLARRARAEGSDRVAAPHWSRAVEICEALIKVKPTAPSRREDLADALVNLAAIREHAGDRADALSLFRRAREILLDILGERGNKAWQSFKDPLALLGVAEMELRVAEVDRSLGQKSGMVEIDSIVERLELENSFEPPERLRLATLVLDLSRWELAAPSWDQASWSAKRALRLYQEIPTNPEAKAGIARSILAIGSIYRDRGRIPEARNEFRRASERFEELAKAEPNEPEYLRQLARAEFEIGRLFDQPDHRAEAIAAYRRSLRVGRELILDYPDCELNLEESVETRQALALALRSEGHVLRAGFQFFLAIADQVGLVKRTPETAANRKKLARLLAACSRLFRTRPGLTGASRAIDRTTN